MTQHPFYQGHDVRPDVERVLPTVHAIRQRLGWPSASCAGSAAPAPYRSSSGQG
jgi:hypothetical protein